MILHLSKKVYLSLDTIADYRYNHLIISNRGYVTTPSLKTDIGGLGTTFGLFPDSTKVNWVEFFATANDRTMIFANPTEFAIIFSKYIKTVCPNISQDVAGRMLDVILKKADWHFVRYQGFHVMPGPEQRELLLQDFADIRTAFVEVFAKQNVFDFEIIPGIEISLGKYWANGSTEVAVKNTIKTLAEKAVLSLARESKQHYLRRWYSKTPGATPQLFEAHLLSTEHDTVLSGELIDDRRHAEYIAAHGLAGIKKLVDWMKADHVNGSMVIELQVYLKTLVDNLDSDWSLILNKNDLMPIASIVAEPIYRVVINGWLIAWLSSRTQE
ncbi:MAG: hypothetical protein WCP55_06940, partial [Lentisphaerota bacterium]